METAIRYQEGSEYSDPKVKVEIRIQILAETGLDRNNYEAIAGAVSDIKTITDKYKEKE